MKEDKRDALTRAPLMASLRGLCLRRVSGANTIFWHPLPFAYGPSRRLGCGFLISACPSSQSTPATVTPSTHPPMRGFRDFGPSSLRSGSAFRSQASALLFPFLRSTPYSKLHAPCFHPSSLPRAVSVRHGGLRLKPRFGRRGDPSPAFGLRFSPQASALLFPSLRSTPCSMLQARSLPHSPLVTRLSR